MQGKRWLLFVSIAVLVFSVMGCSLLDQLQKVASSGQEAATEVVVSGEGMDTSVIEAVEEETPPETESQEATPSQSSEKEATPEEDVASEDVRSLQDLDSYRQKVFMEETTDDETLSWSMVAEVVKDPLKQHILFEGVDEEGDVSSFEMIQIGNTVYIRADTEEEPQWIAISSDEADLPEQVEAMEIEDLEAYLSSSSCRKVGSEDVEGHPAVRYDCDKGVFADEDLFWLGQEILTKEQVKDGGIRFWISKKHGAPVQTIAWLEGEDSEGVYHKLYVEITLSAINEPITIEPPEGVEAPGLPEDVPLMEEARITSAMTGMVSFEVEMEKDQVLEFFKNQMPEHGWALESDYGEMLSFSKDGRQANIMVSEEDGKISGVIMIIEE